MNRLFFYTLFWVGLALVILFTPIFLTTDALFNIKQKKIGFSVRLYGVVKLIGGYISTYTHGLAVHVSKNKAILIPFKDLDNERKRFSFMRTFKMVSFYLNIETGVEYCIFFTPLHYIANLLLYIKYQDPKRYAMQTWITNGETLIISMQNTVFFNGYIVLKNFLKFIIHKVEYLWQNKTKKSTT